MLWLRPDVLYIDPIPVLSELDVDSVYVPRWGGDYKGINDRAMLATGITSSSYLDLYKGQPLSILRIALSLGLLCIPMGRTTVIW